MHSNPSFRREDEAKSIAVARASGVGVLSINGADAPLISHIPFLLEADGSLVGAHLTRSNPILAALKTPQPAVLAVTLGTQYISPDWYGAEDQVPTLNYIAIHLRGTLSVLPADQLRPHIDAMSAHFEGQYDKLPWTSAKMTPAVLERMMRAIVPISLKVEEINATWKLNQNKPAEQRLAAADHVDNPVIAAAMRAVGE